MRYYAFEYFDGIHTTIGNQNPYTGRYDIAGKLVVFNTKKERDSWLLKGTKKRRSLTAKEAKDHKGGHTLLEFKKAVEEYEWTRENNLF